MSLSLRLIEHLKDLESLRAQWDELASRANAGLYQTWEWTFASAKYHSDMDRLYILTAWDGSQLVGAASFVWRVHNRRLVTTRDLQPLGATHPETVEILAAEEYSRAVAERLAAHLTREAFWDRLLLNSIPTDSPATAHFLSIMQDQGHHISPHTGRPLLVVRLPLSFDDYLSTLHRKTRKNLLWKARHLAKHCMVEELPPDQDLAEALHRFLELHDLRWRLLQRRSLLADQRLRSFYGEIARLLHERGWLRLTFLRSESRYIAAEVVIWHNGRAYARQSGLDVSGAWARYSPGLILTLKNIERAIQGGLREFRLGLGDEPYKRDFGPEEIPTTNYRIVSRALETRAKLLFEVLVLRTRKAVRTVVASSQAGGA